MKAGTTTAAQVDTHVSVPSRRALLTATAALAAWFAVMNIGSIGIASIAGYHGKTGMLFALSMSPGYGPAGALTTVKLAVILISVAAVAVGCMAAAIAVLRRTIGRRAARTA